MDFIINWFITNFWEVFGAVSGILYLFFSIRQNILLWPLGILTSAIYVYVLFVAGLYADMSLNAYYVVISVYGWYYWLKGSSNKQLADNELKISVVNNRQALELLGLTVILYGIILVLLLYLPEKLDFPKAQIPYLDAFTTAGSVVATWMLARKILEQWLIWIVVDAVSLGYYFYKELYATTVLFAVYTVMAVVGYLQWRKNYLQQQPGIYS